MLLSGIYLALITETLSAFKWITSASIITIWAVPVCCLLGYRIYKRNQNRDIREIGLAIVSMFRKSWVFVAVITILLISGFIGIIYPPNNYDSLTYHMARVGHWIQNQSISHYQTHILRQLIFPPFSEWTILHIQLLTGSDRLANVVQLFFFGGCILTVSLLIKELGGNLRQQILGILFSSLIPMAIIQSNTTQNDIVVAFFVLAFVYYVIRLLKNFTLPNIFFCGIALGLAWLTKGTAYLFTSLFAVWLILLILKEYKSPLKLILKRSMLLMMIPILAASLNYGHYYRNMFLTDTPLGKANEGMTNEDMAVKPLLVVTLKNIMNHLPVNSELKSAVVKGAAHWGVDANDPRNNYNTIDWMAEGFSFHEDYAQNFIHTLLIIILGIALLFKRNLYIQPVSYYLLFTVTVFASALLFCFLLKWQPWSNRLETTLFMLFSVFLAIEAGSKKKWIQIACYLPMLGFAITALLYSKRHPLLPIKESIFKNSYRSFLYYREGLFDCIDYINNTSYKNVGLYIGADSPDYPYYKLLSTLEHRRIIKDIFVQNESTMYLDSFVPDVIISPETARDKYIIEGKTYIRTKVFIEGPAVFEPE